VGLADTNSAVAALLANLGVVVVAGLSPKVLGEKVTSRVAVAVALTFVGGTLLATRGDLATLSSPEFRAAAAIAVGSMIWSVFVVLNKLALDRGVGTDAELSWGVLVLTAVWLVPAVFLIDGQPRIIDPALAWGTAFYTGVLCSSVSYVIYMAGLRRLGATVAAVVTVAEIVVAFVLTVVVYGSVLSGVAAAGALLVVAGIVLAGLQQSRWPKGEGTGTLGSETLETR
jgi:DME family drug/metabolite transporter